MDQETRSRLDSLEARVLLLQEMQDQDQGPFARAAEVLRRMPPIRPEGEQDDRLTVSRVREELAKFFEEVHEENLAMRPTLELLKQVLDGYRELVKGDEG